mmetsp:Transcript_145507/g.405554  ORF Transcript_145507/g.405554 Transcript_145507/m.405554 type:complete len:223 (+) Transcript_145507:433-1101(+)
MSSSLSPSFAACSLRRIASSAAATAPSRQAGEISTALLGRFAARLSSASLPPAAWPPQLSPELAGAQPVSQAAPPPASAPPASPPSPPRGACDSVVICLQPKSLPLLAAMEATHALVAPAMSLAWSRCPPLPSSQASFGLPSAAAEASPSPPSSTSGAAAAPAAAVPWMSTSALAVAHGALASSCGLSCAVTAAEAMCGPVTVTIPAMPLLPTAAVPSAACS